MTGEPMTTAELRANETKKWWEKKYPMDLQILLGTAIGLTIGSIIRWVFL
jgi:hypothetical protein